MWFKWKGEKVMKKIEVLGTGCPNCKKLLELAQQAAKELDIDCQIIKVDDITKILEYEVMMTPALVVNGQVKLAGRVPKIEELKKLIS
jgi:small redox-active disulfide protein 2